MYSWVFCAHASKRTYRSESRQQRANSRHQSGVSRQHLENRVEAARAKVLLLLYFVKVCSWYFTTERFFGALMSGTKLQRVCLSGHTCLDMCFSVRCKFYHAQARSVGVLMSIPYRRGDKDKCLLTVLRLLKTLQWCTRRKYPKYHAVAVRNIALGMTLSTCFFFLSFCSHSAVPAAILFYKT